jgi:hypothetical protein
LAIGFASPSEQPLLAFLEDPLAQHSSLARVRGEIKILDPILLVSPLLRTSGRGGAMDERSNQNRDREEPMDEDVIGRAPAEDPDADDSEQFEDDDFENADEDSDDERGE